MGGHSHHDRITCVMLSSSTNGRILGLVALVQVWAAQTCHLQPLQQNDLDATTYRLVDTKYGDGITATQVYNATRHGRCVNEIPSICNWKFKYCGTNSMYNNTATAIFALESQNNPGNFMYANVASAESHFSVPEENICTSSNRYMWYAFYADCTDRYYFFNIAYADWLDASDLGLVKHTTCSSGDPFNTDGGCGSWRDMYLFS